MDGVNDKVREMEKAATDIYTFENLRRNGYTYIDKTAILKQLADMSRGKQFFIARPRRFGKSLAVSTLQCLFECRRDLFQNLAIEPEWDWPLASPLHIRVKAADGSPLDLVPYGCARLRISMFPDEAEP